MPDADSQTRTQLLVHQFLTGILVEVSKQLRAAGEIENLETILQRAQLLLKKKQMDTVETLTEQVTALTKLVTVLNTQQNPCQSPHQPASLHRNME